MQCSDSFISYITPGIIYTFLSSTREVIHMLSKQVSWSLYSPSLVYSFMVKELQGELGIYARANNSGRK